MPVAVGDVSGTAGGRPLTAVVDAESEPAVHQRNAVVAMIARAVDIAVQHRIAADPALGLA